MFDIALRSLKDRVFNPISRSVPQAVTPLHLTAAALAAGLVSCSFACIGHRRLSLLFWAANRGLDCLDGAVARHRNQQSDLGSFLDLLGDFVVYALVPIACAAGNSWAGGEPWHQTAVSVFIVALLEASFWLNNFVLLYIAVLVEKRSAEGVRREEDEVTGLAMRPALIEGFESGLFFTAMLAMPVYIGPLASIMFAGVVFGTWQRVTWLVSALQPTKKTA